MRLGPSAAALAATAALLAGCSTSTASTEPANTVSQPSTAGVAALPTSSPAVVPAPSGPPTIPVGTWGDTITLPSGFAVTVAKEGYRPPMSGTVGTGADVFKITFKNGTGQPVEDGLLTSPTVTVGDDNHGVDRVMWEGYKYKGSTTILPGESATIEDGIDALATGAGPVRMEFDVPRYLGPQPVIFKGPAK